MVVIVFFVRRRENMKEREKYKSMVYIRKLSSVESKEAFEHEKAANVFVRERKGKIYFSAFESRVFLGLRII